MVDKGKKKTPSIIDVFPIGRGSRIQSLSFFTSDNVERGDLVTVPIRNKPTIAIVSKVRKVSDAKAAIKSAGYALKKASDISPKNILLPQFVNAIETIAKDTISTPGSVLYSLTPTTLLKELYTQKDFKIERTDKVSGGHFDTYVIQSEDAERFAEYKSIIREEFARKSSVFFCVPTKEDGVRAKAQLVKGIEQYTYVLHAGLNKKELLKTWMEIINQPHAVVIIGTPSFLSIPRNDIGSIIIERESSGAYKLIERPFIDIRTAAREIAQNLNARIIYGDSLLRIETIWKQKEGQYIELQPLKFRHLSSANEGVVTPEKSTDGEKVVFSALSTKALNLIKRNKEENDHMCIITTRKGLAPTTVCSDCGTTVTCKNCSASVTLHSSSKGNFYLCHRCGDRREADTHCTVCDSWRLTMLGIGTETIVKEIDLKMPDVHVLRLDREITKTPKQIARVMEEFYNSPGSVLVGTEMALRHLHEKIDNIVIASVDSLFALPDFRIHEKILHVIMEARSKAQKNFMIQTRNGDKQVFEYGMGGNLNDFYKENIADRKALFYPPFSKLIKITLEGNKSKIVAEMEEIQKKIGRQHIDVFPAFVARKNRKTSMHALIRIDYRDWPDESLMEKLKELPASVSINVEPESIL